MKKIFSILLILSSLTIFSQVDENSSHNFDFDFYFGMGAQITNNYTLNDKLKLANLPELKKQCPSFKSE